MIYQNENFNGELDFRSAWHNGWLIDAHLHEFTELLYYHKGEGDVFVNGKHIRLTEKTMVWIPPNYIHQYDCPRALLICAVFSKDLIPLYFRATQEQRPIPTAVDACDVADILELFPHLSKEEYVKVSGYLNLICAKVLELSQYEPAQKQDGILYQKVISYISCHYTQEITLEQIARKFGYNEKYLSHTLHKLTGIHFTQLLSLYRIDCAKKLLLETDSNISDIAFRCGFSALNTFNRAFKKMTGLSPSQYRKSYSV